MKKKILTEHQEAQLSGPEVIGSVLNLPVSDVIAKPQVRQFFSGIDELANSLAIEGQQSPIIVYPANSHGKFLIQKGERRWRACQKAGIKYIKAIVNDVPANPLEETAAELIENIQRESLTSLEIGRALSSFIEAGWKQVDIAARIGKSNKYVSMHLGLLNLPQCVADLFEKRAVTDADTLNTLRRIYELDSERCLELCQTGLTQGLQRQQCRYVLRYLLSKLTKVENSQTTSSGGRARPAPTRRSFGKPLLNGYREGASSDVPWVSVPHESVIVLTEIQIEGARKVVRLITDRISFDKSLVWIEIEEDNGSKVVRSVNVAELKLLSISD